MPNDLILPDKLEIANRAIAEASTIVIAGPSDYARAGKLCADIRVMEKDLAAAYSEHPAIIVAKELQAQKSDLANRMTAAREFSKRSMIAWDDAQEAKRRADEAAAQAAMQKQLDEQALAEAASLESAGDSVAAGAVLESVAIAPAIILPKETPKVSGHKVATYWDKWEVSDASLIPEEYWCLDEKKIGQVVRAMKCENPIPGIRAFSRRG